MRFPSAAVVIAAVVAAIPFGWGLGVVAAYVIGGSDFGQLPVMTVPIAIVASIVFALVPVFAPLTRLKILIAGIALFAVALQMMG